MDVAEVLGTLTTAANSVKAVVEAIKAALDKAKGKEALAKLIDAQKLALSVQSSLIEAKEQALALQEENRQLRVQLRQYEKAAQVRENYEHRKVGDTAVVVGKDDPETYLCATCFDQGFNAYLIPGNYFGGTHLCPICQVVVSLR